VPGAKLKAEALEKAARHASTSTQQKALAEAASGVIDELAARARDLKAQEAAAKGYRDALAVLEQQLLRAYAPGGAIFCERVGPVRRARQHLGVVRRLGFRGILPEVAPGRSRRRGFGHHPRVARRLVEPGRSGHHVPVRLPP